MQSHALKKYTDFVDEAVLNLQIRMRKWIL